MAVTFNARASPEQHSLNSTTIYSIELSRTAMSLINCLLAKETAVYQGRVVAVT
jgi:hypothetical protein